MALSYVGGKSAAGTGASYSVDLTTLSGGSNTAPSTGDIIIVVTGVAYNSDISPGVSTAGFIKIGENYSNSTRDANLAAYYKIVGPTVDTSVTVTRPSSTAYAGATAVHVWRGADILMPIDTIPFFVSGGGASRPDPGALTPVTSGAIVLSCGVGTGSTSQTAFAIPSASNAVILKADGTTSDVVTGIGSYTWTSGSYNPAAFTGGTTSISDSWCAVTIALRPGVDNPPFVSLALPTDTYSTSDGNILFDITGTDIEADPVDFNLQVDTSNTFTGRGYNIADDFDDGTVGSIWNNWSPTFTSESSGLLHMDIPANGGANWAGVHLNDRKDIRGYIAKIELTNAGFAGQPSGSAFGVIPLKYTGTVDNEHYIEYLLEMSGATPVLRVRRKCQNLQWDLVTVNYNTTNHRWFRIRENGGELYFETAPQDQSAWTEIVRVGADQLPDIDLTSIKIEIGANCWTGITTPTGSEFDNFSFGGNAMLDAFSFWDRETFYNPDTTSDVRPFNSGENIKVALLEDSYKETNVDTYKNFTSTITEVGQTFKCLNGLNLTKAKFYLKKTNSPAGNMVAKLYKHTVDGFGSTGIPTGDPVATSDTVAISTVGTSASLIEFTFSTPYFLGINNNYVITVSYTGSDASNYLQLGYDATLPTDDPDGTLVSYNGSWSTDSTADCAFYIYGALDPGTYYWRARAIDPIVADGGTGGGKIGYWSPTYSFTVTGTPRVFPRVMCIGDSITVGVGKTDKFGYRGALQYLLGVDKYQFVGGGSDPDFDEALDIYHDGRNMERTDEIEARIAAALDASMTSAPAGSWVLIHAGTNDINQNYAGGVSAYVQNVKDMIDLIVAHDANINVCVALITPSKVAGDETTTQSYNSALNTMLTTYQATKTNLYIADMHTKFTNNANWATEWMYDDVHPNDTGYDKMAEEWYAAMFPTSAVSASFSPSLSPSTSPSASLSPSYSPSLSKSLSPSFSPSLSKSFSPSLSPSFSPSLSKSFSPSFSPSVSPSASFSPSRSPSFSPSVSPTLSASFSPSVSPSASFSPSFSPSRSPSFSPSFSPSRSPSLSASFSPSVSPSASFSPSFSLSVSPSFSPSFSPSLSASISPSISPSAPEGFNYTRESRDTLPTVVTDLATAFTPTEYTQVATDDTDRVDLTVNNIFGIYLFKIQNSNNTDNIDVTWNGQSSQAPTSSPVKLQIWDWEGSIWEDMDEENGVGANTDFNLTGTRSSEPHHYSGTFVVACRVYQENKL